MVKSPATTASAPLKVIAVALLDLISFPVTVKSPLTVVSVAVIAIVPLLRLSIFSPNPNVRSFPVMVKSSVIDKLPLVVIAPSEATVKARVPSV